jgi:hypothetical protein
MKLLKTMRAQNHARIVAEADVDAAVKAVLTPTLTLTLLRKRQLML